MPFGRTVQNQQQQHMELGSDGMKQVASSQNGDPTLLGSHKQLAEGIRSGQCSWRKSRSNETRMNSTFEVSS